VIKEPEVHVLKYMSRRGAGAVEHRLVLASSSARA
jgi:hypothetical protein